MSHSMTRSRVNRIMADAAEMIERGGFTLPPFARWTPDEAKAKMMPAIRDARLGWDITDFGAGDFDRMGLFLFTLRNGSLADLKAGRGMVYAEKLLISQENQLSPLHTHFLKTEDIINRSGATLVIQLCGSHADGSVDRKKGVRVVTDGVTREVEAGGLVKLGPGESITLQPGDWHAFWGEGGAVLIGEVSTVNDDLTDNIYADPIGRFADIAEDEPPTHLLVADYDRWLG